MVTVELLVAGGLILRTWLNHRVGHLIGRRFDPTDEAFGQQLGWFATSLADFLSGANEVIEWGDPSSPFRVRRVGWPMSAWSPLYPPGPDFVGFAYFFRDGPSADIASC